MKNFPLPSPFLYDWLEFIPEKHANQKGALELQLCDTTFVFISELIRKLHGRQSRAGLTA